LPPLTGCAEAAGTNENRKIESGIRRMPQAVVASLVGGMSDADGRKRGNWWQRKQRACSEGQPVSASGCRKESLEGGGTSRRNLLFALHSSCTTGGRLRGAHRLGPRQAPHPPWARGHLSAPPALAQRDNSFHYGQAHTGRGARIRQGRRPGQPTVQRLGPMPLHPRVPRPPGCTSLVGGPPAVGEHVPGWRQGGTAHLGSHAERVVQVASHIEQQGVHVQHPAGLAGDDAKSGEVDATAAPCTTPATHGLMTGQVGELCSVPASWAGPL
jgi:hypothetical protein